MQTLSLSRDTALTQQELQRLSHEAFMRKADQINNVLYKLALAAICVAIMGLLFFAPEAFAQAGGSAGMDEAKEKLTGFLTGVKKILGPISILVVTIAFIFAGYQIAFNHKRIADVAPVLIGAIIIGAAAQLAKMFIDEGDFK